jgi:hypothetical protein
VVKVYETFLIYEKDDIKITERDEKVFDNRALKRIFGPKREE